MLNKLVFLLATFTFLQVTAQEQTYNCLFRFNSAEYQSDSIIKLQQWLIANNALETTNFELIAYTDTNGSVEYNDYLAKRRIENITQILKSNGYQITDARTIGKRYMTNTYTRNAEFRKVEIHIIPKIVKSLSEETNTDQQIEWNDTISKIIFISEETLEKNRLEEFEKMGTNTIINLNIEFQNGTSVYKNKESEKQVYYLSQYLKKHPKKKVMILGHVCCSNNQAVSVMRARQVYEDLSKYNINKKRMKFKGMSNTDPLVPEISKNAEQQNRRVEVIFYEK